MTFDEREAIKIRIQQIFLERQSLQEEYKTLFSLLREIDERDSNQTSSDKELVGNNHCLKDPKTNSLTWEDFELKEVDEENINTKEYDKRLAELQSFLESEK